MRFFSIVTACVVMLTIYLAVFERPALMAVAEGDFGALRQTALVEIVAGPAAGAQDETIPEAADVPGSDEDADTVAAPDTPTEEDEAARRVAVVAMRSEATGIDRAVILRGRTEAARAVEVRAETSGRIVSEPLRKGTHVEAGQILCDLAPGTRRAALDEARARLSEAEINFNAATQLSQGGFASETRTAGARAALQSAQAGVAAAEEELSRLRIAAPFSGLLESDAAELGALLQPGALCATVIQLDPIRLVGFVPETDVDKIEPGAQAGARLASGREVTGAVTFLARAADPATRTFRVEITVDNSDLSIRDGQTAEIGIAATGVVAHLVPGSALTLNDAGRLGLRLVDEDSRARFAPVEVVRDTTRGIWVTGLPEAAEIIVVGQEFVNDGVPLRVTFRDGPIAPDSARSLLEAVAAGRGGQAAEPTQ